MTIHKPVEGSCHTFKAKILNPKRMEAVNVCSKVARPGGIVGAKGKHQAGGHADLEGKRPLKGPLGCDISVSDGGKMLLLVAVRVGDLRDGLLVLSWSEQAADIL